MSDAKLKQELLYMVRIAEKYDLTDKDIVNIILREDAEGRIFSSVFGQRFKARIKDLSEGKSDSDTCIICGKPDGPNTVICSPCKKSIGDSYYAKHISGVQDKKEEAEAVQEEPSLEEKEALQEQSSAAESNDLQEQNSVAESIVLQKQISASETKDLQENTIYEKIVDSKAQMHLEDSLDLEETDFSAASNNLKESLTSRIHIPAKLKKIIAVIAILILSLAAVCQIGILCLYMTIPDRNIPMEARVSSYEPVPVSDEAQALAAISQDFPESEGYTITFCRMDREYVGALSTKLGQAVLTDTAGLSDEELYDYYMTDTVYIFFISYLENYTGRLGVAEINAEGQILIQGAFNDGRDSNLQYRFR